MTFYIPSNPHFDFAHPASQKALAMPLALGLRTIFVHYTMITHFVIPENKQARR